MENKPLTIAEAGILFGHQYQLQDNERRLLTIQSVNQDSFLCTVGNKFTKDVYFDEIGKDYFIRARSLSSLTETIVVEGKEIVPIVDALKLIYPQSYSYPVKAVGVICGAENIKKYTLSLDFILRDNKKEILHYDQQHLFNYLYSLHFDTMNLEERGLCKIIK